MCSCHCFLISDFFCAVQDAVDYQGRSFLHAPQDVGVNLRSDIPPDKCFLPKAHIHTWSGHSKGIAALRWLPRTAHLLLSASMDCRIKVQARNFRFVLIGFMTPLDFV